MEEGEFYIAFDTKINPGKVEAVRVRIDLVTIDDMDKSMNIALCNHPLYKELKQYVKANR